MILMQGESYCRVYVGQMFDSNSVQLTTGEVVNISDLFVPYTKLTKDGQEIAYMLGEGDTAKTDLEVYVLNNIGAKGIAPLRVEGGKVYCYSDANKSYLKDKLEEGTEVIIQDIRSSNRSSALFGYVENYGWISLRSNHLKKNDCFIFPPDDEFGYLIDYSYPQYKKNSNTCSVAYDF